MQTIGYTHGRFQPFHKGHLSILQHILDNYDELWVGIANPLRRLPHNIEDLEEELKESVKKARLKSKNIFSFMERREMILNTFKEKGVELSRIKIFPHFGYYEENNWNDFMPPKDRTTIVLHAKDPHHDKKIALYKKQGWQIEALPLFEGGVSGTEFHKNFPEGNWKTLVSPATAAVITKSLLQKR